MWNVVLGAAVAAAIAGSSEVYAQQQQSAGERGPYLNSAQQDRTDSTNVGDTLASLKQRLRLSPEQEKNWPAFESAYRALSDYRRERMRVRREQELPSDPAERMRHRAESLTGMGAALARLADAEAPLYGSLSDDQKRQFAALSLGLAFRSEMQRRQNDDDLDTHRDGRGSAGSYDRDDRARRHSGEDDRAGWRGRDERDGRGWREGDDYDRAARAAGTRGTAAAGATATITTSAARAAGTRGTAAAGATATITTSAARAARTRGTAAAGATATITTSAARAVGTRGTAAAGATAMITTSPAGAAGTRGIAGTGATAMITIAPAGAAGEVFLIEATCQRDSRWFVLSD